MSAPVPTTKEPSCVRGPLEHEITLNLASGANLKLRYFSDREMRWIFSYNYTSTRRRGMSPDIINDIRLVANYADGRLDERFILSMHVIIPSRLGQESFLGLDISPGAKTYLAFSYDRCWSVSPSGYALTEICKGTKCVSLDSAKPALVQPLWFPFPVPNHVPIELGKIRVPFRTNAELIDHFDLPESTLR